MGMVIGIDVGGSTTKIVGIDKGHIHSPMFITAADPVTSLFGAFGKYIYDNGIQLADVEQVMLTGVGSAFVDSPLYGLPTRKTDEFLANGLAARHALDNDQLIVVTYHSVDGQNVLQCRSVTLELYPGVGVISSMIDQKDLSKGLLLFQDDLFTSPSYFEFDEYNEIIITFCATKQYVASLLLTNREYKIWRQSDYSFLYSICDEKIQEMRVGSAFDRTIILEKESSSLRRQ